MVSESPSVTDVQRTLEDSLDTYVNVRQARVLCETQLETLAKPLRVWLNDHEGEELYDGEHKIRGFLQPRRGAPPYDLRHMYERDKLLFEQLLYNGCLRVDNESVKRAGALVGGVKAYAGPEPVTYALQVLKED